MKAECVRALKGLALPRASHSGSGEITLAGSRRLCYTLAAALFAHAVVTVAKKSTQ